MPAFPTAWFDWLTMRSQGHGTQPKMLLKTFFVAMMQLWPALDQRLDG